MTHARSKIKTVESLGKNFDRDAEVIDIIASLFKRYEIFTIKDLAYLSNKMTERNEPMVQYFARSLQRLTDSGFLKSQNILSKRGSIIDKVYSMVSDPITYKATRVEGKKEYEALCKERRQKYIERMKNTSMVLFGPEDELEEDE